MSIIIISPDKDTRPWLEALKALEPELDIRIWPDDGDRSSIRFALTWSHPTGVLQQYPMLSTVSSMGAGIDHILNDTLFPKGVVVTRVVAPQLASSMFDYLNTVVSSIRHHLIDYANNQRQRAWNPLESINKRDLTIGILGLGSIGGIVAQCFAEEGHPVLGWSNTPKAIPQVTSYCTTVGLNEMLRQTKVLINLLPLTEKTRSFLNHDCLSQLSQNAYLINVGRGEHLIEADLIDLLDRGHLKGACLDVFQREPLSKASELWLHPKIKITPHVSSLTQPESVAPQIIENYWRAQKGEPLLYQVDLRRGY